MWTETRLSVANLTANHGSVTANGNGTWTITPVANYNGAVSLGYNVVDGNGGSAAATQSFTLTAVNDAPRAARRRRRWRTAPRTRRTP